MGALNRHEVHCGTGSPLEGVGTALWTQWRGSPKLKHSEARMAARWGRLDDRLPNGAASKANRNVVQPLWRIGRNRHGGKETAETGEVMAQHGIICGVNARANITTTDNGIGGTYPQTAACTATAASDERGMAPWLRASPDNRRRAM